MTNEANKPVWQWHYSAFGNNKPTGILAATPNPKAAPTNQPVLLKATNPAQELGLRFPGQMHDQETGWNYNYLRYYWAMQGRYIQSDPIGLAGGWNGYTYADNTPLTIIDPLGLMGQGSGAGGRTPTWGKGGPNTVARPLTFSAFGCMGLMCASGGMHNDGPQFSAELTFGGGFEICEPPPPPPPEPESCRRNDGSGFYSGPGKAQVQPPGIPVPRRFGGAFFGPSWKANGQFCLRVGPHGSVPFVPSIDLPPPRS